MLRTSKIRIWRDICERGPGCSGFGETSANLVPAAPGFAGVRRGGSCVSRLCGCRAGSVSAGPVLGGWRRRGVGCVLRPGVCVRFGALAGRAEGGSSGGDRLGCVPPVVGGVGWGASCSPGLVWAWGWLVLVARFGWWRDCEIVCLTSLGGRGGGAFGLRPAARCAWLPWRSMGAGLFNVKTNYCKDFKTE